MSHTPPVSSTAQSTSTKASGPGGGPALRRELSIWEAIGVSVALMAPSMAANINPQGTAGLVGRAVPLAFLIGTVAVLFIAYTFVRLSQRFNHSGSVYGFVGATLGARSGAFSGWALAGTYIFYGAVTSMAAARFIVALLQESRIWTEAPDWLGFPIGLVVLALVFFLASRPARGGTRLLLAIEGITVALILIVAIVVLARLLGGSAPGGATFDLSVFSVPGGTDASTLFLGVVFAFLSFAGFEAASTLGEETRNPRKDIPRAILGTAIFGGVYFVFVTAIEVMGFGTDASGIKRFIASGSLIGDLGSSYLSPVVGTIITIGAAVSAIGCALACTVGASRLIFALSRDGLGPAGLAKVSEKHNIPGRAALVVVLVVGVIEVFSWLVLRVTPFDVFLASGTIGTLILLVVYALATIGAIKLLFFSGERRVAVWEIVIPVVALLVLVYTLVRNVYPFPTTLAAWAGPGIAALWLVVTLVVVLIRRNAARRAGELLTRAEGLSLDRAPANEG